MKNVPAEPVKELTFSEFVIEQLKKEARVKNVLGIVLQDVYMFLGRNASVGGPEPERIAKLITKIETEHGDVMTIDEGFMNRQKDKAIRQLFVYELMRQYTNFKKTQTK